MSVKNQYQDIVVGELLVNPENPRALEEMDDEAGAINFLLEDIPDRMKTLAQDIADKGYVYDPPLVRKEGATWKVYDGNRRVACVKLMHDPMIASDPVMQKFFEKLAATHKASIPHKIHCRIEDDQKIINDILERRHAGGDTGIGQMAWKPEEKENFFVRSGIPHKARFGTELSRVLKEKGVLDKGDRIKVSILDRLLSSEANKNRVGLSFKDNKFHFIADEKRALTVIKRIIKDAEAGDINLNRTWSKADKEGYFSHLENEGFLPIVANDHKAGDKKKEDKSSSESTKDDQEKKKQKKDKPYTRPHLIPEGLEFNFDSSESTSRIRNIIIELQSHLYFSRSPNAIAVLFRVLIEMCVDHYIDSNQIVIKTKNKHGPSLAEKFDACLSDLVGKKRISDKHRKILVKFSQPEQFLSADTFHAFIHHRMAHPLQSDLIAMWEQMQPFIVQSLVDQAEQKKTAA